jgi:hypothetical protein
MDTRFGDQPLIEEMRKQRWTYTLLSTRIDATYRQLYFAARGVVAPSPDLRDKLPAVLGVPLSRLFTPEALDADYHKNQALGGLAPRRPRSNQARGVVR